MLSRTSIIVSGAPARVSMIVDQFLTLDGGAPDLQAHLSDGLADVV